MYTIAENEILCYLFSVGNKTKKRVLLIVDVQQDFFPGGALPVPAAEEILPVINRIMKNFPMVIATQDWHPEDHQSFASQHYGKKPFDMIQLSYGPQRLWPNHCVQGTTGAAFHPDFNHNPVHFITRKGYNREIDSYSAFFENDGSPTGLHHLISPRNDFELFVCGLARDYCVEYTVQDAKHLGYSVHVIEEACRGIDIP